MQWTTAQQRLYRWQVQQIRVYMPYSEDDRRAVLKRVTGSESTSDIDGYGMKRVIDEQARLLRQCGVKRERPGGRRSMSQDEYLELLVLQLGWKGQPERLAGWIRREFQGWKTSTAELTRAEKTILITGLKRLVKAERDGRIRADRPQADRPERRSWTPEVIRA